MEELALDIFRTDDFRATTMTELVNDIDYVPYELQNMNIFEDVYLRTTTVTLYQENGELKRLPTTPRGSPEPLNTRRGRVLRQLEGPRIAQRDHIRSEEVQNLLSPRLPQATRLANANDLISERQSELIDNVNYTSEFHRLGGVQGVIYDSDGTSVVENFFDTFGITPPTPITFDFTDYVNEEDQGKLRRKIDEDIVTPGRRILKRRYRPGTKYHALVGDDFWFELTSSPAFERTMQTQLLIPQLNDSRAWGSVELADVVWHHYYGDDDQELQIEADEAIFFPLGAKDVFKAYHFPGENMDEVNDVALDYYSIVSPDYRPNMNEWVDLYVRKYVLFACLCPQALMKGVLA